MDTLTHLLGTICNGGPQELQHILMTTGTFLIGTAKFKEGTPGMVHAALVISQSCESFVPIIQSSLGTVSGSGIEISHAQKIKVIEGARMWFESLQSKDDDDDDDDDDNDEKATCKSTVIWIFVKT